jgi:hypothetical protein
MLSHILYRPDVHRVCVMEKSYLVYQERGGNMPFIEQSKRPAMDKVIDEILLRGVRADGSLNYVLYKLCKKHVTPGYINYRNFVGELRECIEQIERDLIAPYEEEAKQRNGDV